MKTLLLVLASSLLTIAAQAKMVQSPLLETYTQVETHRQAAVQQARDATEFLDAATPDDVQSQWFQSPEDQEQDQAPDQSYAPPRSEQPVVRQPLPQQPEDDVMPPRSERSQVRIDVSIANQTLTMNSPAGSYTAVISSARRGYHTVTGCYHNPTLHARWFSAEYNNSPMPHAMFFHGGYAIHGTYEVNELGRPASHGCVRVSPDDAEYLFSVVQYYRPVRTTICVH